MNNSPKIIFPNEFKHNEVMFENPKSDNNNGNGGGGNMSYVSKDEFKQYEKRMDDNLQTINTSISGLPDRIDEKLETKIEKMKNSQMRWFIVTLLGIAGVAGRVFGLY